MAKSNDGCGYFIGLTLALTLAVFVGCWWWAGGLPVFGRPTRGWRRVLTVVARVAVLVAAGWVVEMPGAVHWWGFGALVVCGAAGWWAFFRRYSERAEAGQRSLPV